MTFWFDSIWSVPILEKGNTHSHPITDYLLTKRSIPKVQDSLDKLGLGSSVTVLGRSRPTLDMTTQVACYITIRIAKLLEHTPHSGTLLSVFITMFCVN